MNSLLDDLKDDLYERALSHGAVDAPKKKQEWTGEKQWVSQGFTAHILFTYCDCGAIEKRLLGVFEKTRSPSGATKEILCSHEQIKSINKEDITTTANRQTVQDCFSCFFQR